MAKHHFGIIDLFEENKKYYTFEPDQYNCVPLDMEIMDFIIVSYLDKIKMMKTYLCESSRLFYGIDESGITIIPPESLSIFNEIIADAVIEYESVELVNLLKVINKAIRQHKHLIHYGI